MPNRLLMAALAGAMTFAFTAPAFAESSPWQVRARAIGVLPDEDASLNPDLEADVDDSWMPELDFTYFFSDNIAAELILATTEHDVSAGGTDLGSVWVLPPTLLLQYHFNSTNQVRPYVGAGVNYTIFYGEDQPTGIDFDYEDSFGFALQAGVDYFLDEHWLINFDVKKLWLSTGVDLNSGAVTGEVDLDPWVIGFGFGYRY